MTFPPRLENQSSHSFQNIIAADDNDIFLRLTKRKYKNADEFNCLLHQDINNCTHIYCYTAYWIVLARMQTKVFNQSFGNISSLLIIANEGK